MRYIQSIDSSITCLFISISFLFAVLWHSAYPLRSGEYPLQPFCVTITTIFQQFHCHKTSSPDVFSSLISFNAPISSSLYFFFQPIFLHILSLLLLSPSPIPSFRSHYEVIENISPPVFDLLFPNKLLPPRISHWGQPVNLPHRKSNLIYPLL